MFVRSVVKMACVSDDDQLKLRPVGDPRHSFRMYSMHYVVYG
jgi:hypothetical protein